MTHDIIKYFHFELDFFVVARNLYGANYEKN